MSEVASQKELTVVKRKTTNIAKEVEAIDVSDNDAVKKAGTIIKEAKKWLKGERDKYIAPAKEIIAQAKDQYDPFIKNVEDVEKKLKARVTEYVTEQNRIAEKERQRLADRVERGTMKAETAVDKMEKIEDPGKSVGGVTVRTIKKMRITDASLIPREFLVPDEVAIRKALLNGQEIPGAEIYEDQSASL